jgi:hypothetical protein
MTLPGLRNAQNAPERENPRNGGDSKVELGGLEPPTSWVRSRRSPN